MEETKYVILTTEQANVLEQILEALQIPLEDFLLVGKLRSKLKSLDEAIEKVDKSLEVIASFQENLIQLNNRISEVERSIRDMEMNDVMGVLRQDEDENI